MFHVPVIKRGEDAKRAHDMPILLNQAGACVERVGGLFNETQNATHLIITPQIAEIRAQENIAAFAID